MNKLDSFLLLVPGTIWGISFIVVELVIDQIEPISLTLLRSIISVVMLLIMLRMAGGILPRTWQEWRPFFLLAACNQAIPFALTAWGQIYIDGGLASILLSTMPLFTVILASFFMPDESFTTPKVIGITLGLIGIIILIGPTALTGLGINIWAQLAVIASALLYAIGAILLRRVYPLQPAGYSIWAIRLRITTAQFITTVLMLLPFSLWLEEPWAIETDLRFWLYMLFLGIGVTLFATVTYFYLIENLGAGTASTTVYLIPVSGVILGALILGETLRPSMLIALALILGGIFLINRFSAQPQARLEEAKAGD